MERVERAECVERIEREGEGERIGTGGMFKTVGAEETGADLVVWRGGKVGEEGVVSSGSEEVENGMEDKRSKNEGESLPSNNFFLSASAMFLVARLASNFSVRNFSYNTSFVLTFNIIICVDRTAVLNAAKSQWSGFRTSIVPHLNFLTNTPLRSEGGPSMYGRFDCPYPSPCGDLSSP